CQISTLAAETAAQLAFTLTTLIVSVRTVPVLVSRMSLRKISVTDGYGPMVSVGVTAQALFVDPVVVPVVVVVAEGLVDELLQPKASAAPAAAPIAPIASRRLIRFIVTFKLLVSLFKTKNVGKL